ncbi:MAG: hypothetical protein GTO46_12655 [Gemmatimonadetes bacterium]|nr:hypothetical protein [Gemmatimonadota bacterium]NIO32439.1 hypothetical protein [Gemmatimonadota bacterium]
MNATVKLCAVGALTLTVAACAARQAADEGAAVGGTGREVTIEVENQNFYDARIYVVEYGRRRRLGSVPGHGTRVFQFRVDPTEVRFVIDFIGSGQLTTNIRNVRPGDELLLTVTATTHRLRYRGG